MRSITFLIITLFITVADGWLTNFESAQKIAKEKQELILVNFSGSDWCGPCMRMRKEIFESDDFKNFAGSHLVLVNADFPRSSKNKLSKEQVRLNEALADRYNPQGEFPLTLLMNAGGKVIKTWSGLPDETATQFIQEVKAICDAHR